jgi:hypothetical protein
LWRLVKRGRAGDRGLAYFEWGVDSSADFTDRAVWRAVNPGRATMEALEDDFANLTIEDFAREHLGAWDEARDDWVIPKPAWEAIADRSTEPPRPQGKVAFAVDVRPDLSRASIAVAGKRPDGHSQVQVIDDRPGTAWIAPRLAELVAMHPTYGVAVDIAGSARALVSAITAAGVPVIEMNTAEAKEAFGQFYEATVDSASVRHLDQTELNVALKGASTRRVGDALLWDRKSDDVDITPLVAVTNALWGWTTRQHSGDILNAVW